jgi:hypothetical protein
MNHRMREIDRLALDVAAAFRRVPHCPQALTASADGLGNVVIEIHGRTFTISALVVDASMTDEAWCRSVLHLVLGVPGQHVQDLMARALVSGALAESELEVLQAIGRVGSLRVHDHPEWNKTCSDLARKGLLIIRPAHDAAYWHLSAAGWDAFSARR